MESDVLVVMGMFPALSGPVQMPQAPAKGFDLLLVGGLLPLGQLQCLQHFLHFLQSPLEGLDDVVHLFDSLLDGDGRCRLPITGLLDGSGRCRLPLAGGWGGNLPLDRCRFGDRCRF